MGGTGPTGTPQSTVFATVLRPDGNLDAWSQDAALPAPRAQASAVFFSGVAYVIGGLGADGAPTDQVFAGTPDVATGKIAAWTESTDLKLPVPRAGAAVVVAGDGIFLQLGLSYLVAAGMATGNFVLLLLIGYAFNHKERTRAFLHDLRNRRRRTA